MSNWLKNLLDPAKSSNPSYSNGYEWRPLVDGMVLDFSSDTTDLSQWYGARTAAGVIYQLLKLENISHVLTWDSLIVLPHPTNPKKTILTEGKLCYQKSKTTG